MKRLISSGALLSLVVALPLCASPVYAEEAIDLDAVEDPPPKKGGPGIMVRPFEGPRAKTIRDRLVRALTKAGVDLVPADSAKKKLAGDPGPYVDVAKANGVEAFILGKVSMNKKSWTLTLEVRSGATGAVAGSEQITSGWLPGLLKSIDKEAKAKVDTLLAAAKSGSSSPAANAEASGEAEVDTAALVASNAGMDPVSDSDSDADETAVDRTRPLPFVLRAGVGGMMRSFTYSDPILDTKRQELLPHDSPLLNVRVGATWYPGMHFGNGVLSHFGLNGHYIRSLFGSTSVKPEQVPDGAPKEYPTIFQELDVGLRARVPMGSWELGLNFGLGSQQMGLAGDNVVVRLPYATEDEPYPGVIPDIDSTYYRFGGDVTFPWLDWMWVLDAGMRLPNFSEKAGALRHQRWFPGAYGAGATASLGVNVPLSDAFGQIGLLILAEYRRTNIDMNSSTSSIVVNSETDPNQNQLSSSIAGGASDQYLMLTVGLTWGLGGGTSGVASSSGAEEPEEESEPDEDSSESDEAEPEADEEESSPAPAAKPTPAAPPASNQKDTSNPAFFGEAGGSAATPPPAKPPAAGGPDTSNPDFFK